MFSAGVTGSSQRLNEHYYRVDPIVGAVVRKPMGMFVTHRDVVSKTWFRRTESYYDWARRTTSVTARW